MITMNDLDFESLVMESVQDTGSIPFSPSSPEEQPYIVIHWSSIDERAKFARLRKKLMDARSDMYYMYPKTPFEKAVTKDIEDKLGYILTLLHRVLSKKKN